MTDKNTKLSFIEYAEQYMLLLIAFILPLYKPVTPYIIAIWGILAIAVSLIKRKDTIQYIYIPKKITILFFILPFFFVLHLIGLFYSDNLHFGWFDIEVKLSMFIFPLMLFLTRKRFLNDRFFKNLFTAFLLGCFTTIVMNLGWSLIEFNAGKGLEVFYYISVSRFFHPSYVSLYLCFALYILLHRIIDNASNNNRYLMLWHIFFAFLLLFYIFLLSSKAGIISSLMVVIVFFAVLFLKRYTPIVSLGLLGIIFTIFFSSVLLIPNARMRFESMVLAVFNPPNNSENVSDGTTSRINVWESSFNLAIRNMPFGVGTGDVKMELIKEYRANGMEYSADRQLNAHCQYLQSFVAVGVLGLLSLLAMFVFPLWFFKKRIDNLFFILILLFGFNNLFESMFEVQAGVVFFSFFYSILLLKTIFRKNIL